MITAVEAKILSDAYVPDIKKEELAVAYTVIRSRALSGKKTAIIVNVSEGVVYTLRKAGFTLDQLATMGTGNPDYSASW